MNLGIIPAAGRAERFGGIDKELLPAGQGLTLLEEAYRRLERVSEAVVLVTCVDKIQLHARALGDRVIYLVQKGEGLWGAICTAMEIEAERYHLSLPDTWCGPFVQKPGDLALGVFETDEPERFGVLRNGGVVDKQPGPPGLAWGALSWSKRVRDLWLREQPWDYTDALNLAIERYGYVTYPLGYYYDMASFEHYAAWMGRR